MGQRPSAALWAMAERPVGNSPGGAAREIGVKRVVAAGCAALSTDLLGQREDLTAECRRWWSVNDRKVSLQ